MEFTQTLETAFLTGHARMVQHVMSFPFRCDRKLLKKYNHLKEKGAFSVSLKIKRTMEKRHKLGTLKLKKDKKDKKEKEKDWRTGLLEASLQLICGFFKLNLAPYGPI